MYLGLDRQTERHRQTDRQTDRRTYPCPDGAGGVAAAAGLDVLAAAVGDHLGLQGGVPVRVAVHAAAVPLEEGRGTARQSGGRTDGWTDGREHSDHLRDS